MNAHAKSFVVFDTDSHVVEPRTLWETYLDPNYRVLGKTALWREEGPVNCYLKVNGRVFRDRMNPNIPRHAIWQPGMTWDRIGDLDPQVRHPPTPGASARGSRCPTASRFMRCSSGCRPSRCGKRNACRGRASPTRF